MIKAESSGERAEEWELSGKWVQMKKPFRT